MVVNLSDEFIFEDLTEHQETIWKLIQADINKSLVEYDKIEFRAKEWTAFARVNHADSTCVVLYDIRKAQKPAFEVSLYSDASFDVRWGHAGYGYFRTADNVRMSNTTYSTPAACEAALLREQYPARIS